MISLTHWFIRKAAPLLLGSIVVLSGCTSTPQHTNTLVFGTTTRLALDVSQDPTASIGVTLGYKRQEAVWMPLLPNQANATTGKAEPAKCEKRVITPNETTECEMFVGIDGKDQRDTYSVLASFGANAGGSAESTNPNVKANAQIAQYFATGLAARLLAQSGGASLVNTGGESPEALARSKVAVADMEQLIGKVSKDGKAIDKAALDNAFSKSPGKDIPAKVQADIKTATTADELRQILSAYRHASTVTPMLETLRAL